jgi:hypothetical protein
MLMTLCPCLCSSCTRGPPANSHRNLKIATNLSFKAFYWATQERLNAEAKKETVVQLILWVPRVGELPLPKAPSWGLPPHVWGLPPHKPPGFGGSRPLSPSGLGAPTSSAPQFLWLPPPKLPDLFGGRRI